MAIADLTRRALMRAIPALGASVALPAVVEAAVEHPCEKVNRLAFELAEAMHGYNEYFGGEWKATVFASGTREYPVWYTNVGADDAKERLERAKEELQAAAEAFDPTINSWHIRQTTTDNGESVEARLIMCAFRDGRPDAKPTI